MLTSLACCLLAVLTDTERLERTIAEASSKPGTNRCAVVTAKPDGSPWTVERTLRLPSDFTLLLDGAHLTLAPATYCNMFRSEGTTNVTLIGRNGATVDGGEYNGLSERNAGRDGRPPIWVNNLLLFANVRRFRVEGVRFVRQRWWALDFIGCSDGIIRKIDFLSHHVTVKKDGSRIDTVGADYEGILVKNSDGIDLRAGCHDIVIDGVTGFCEDDCVALTCLRGKLEKEFLSKDADYAIRNVTVRNVRADSLCSLVRLLAQDGCKMSGIVVDGVEDVGDGKTYQAGYARYGVRLGDVYLYGRRQAAAGEVTDITIRNVRSRAWECAVLLAGVADNVVIENVTALPECPKAVEDLRLFAEANPAVR